MPTPLMTRDAQGLFPALEKISPKAWKVGSEASKRLAPARPAAPPKARGVPNTGFPRDTKAD
jgi:hypothetical protein